MRPREADAVITLVPANATILAAAIAGDAALAAVLGCRVVGGWATFTEALEPARAAAELAGDATWGAQMFLAGSDPELVGWGGFKGPPAHGAVEIGYEIAPARRGRGLATAAARAMITQAFADPRVRCVVAHTLAEHNASNHILTKLGFRFDAAMAEDGVDVWRYVMG